MERERIIKKDDRDRDSKGLFQKGGRGGPGRPKGSVPKVTIELQKAVLEAAELVGCDGYGTAGARGYLYALAIERPEIFGRLLERVMPVRISGNMTHEHHDRKEYETIEELQEAMKARGLPPPMIDITPRVVK